MKTAQAWLLDLGPFRVAVAYHDVLEVVAEPVVWPLPIGPRWCREILTWRGRYLPLARLGSGESPFAVVLAVACPKHDDRLEYVAMRLKRTPQLIEVRESDDCDLPDQMMLPADHVLASFMYDNEVVLVPDFAALFKIKLQQQQEAA